MTTVARGTLSGIEARREIVVRTGQEWEALWRQHAPERRPPVVDFGTQTIVAIFLGTRATAGHEVTITSVTPEPDDGVLVRYRAVRPDPGMMTAQVLTFPFHIVSVPRFDGGARFERVDADVPR